MRFQIRKTIKSSQIRAIFFVNYIIYREHRENPQNTPQSYDINSLILLSRNSKQRNNTRAFKLTCVLKFPWSRWLKVIFSVNFQHVFFTSLEREIHSGYLIEVLQSAERRQNRRASQKLTSCEYNIAPSNVIWRMCQWIPHILLVSV